MSLIETLVAALIVAIVAGAAVASWSMASRAVASRRATDIGTAIAVSELERLKAIRYPYLPVSPMSGGQPVPTVRWYDRYGNWLGSAATSGDYRAESTVTVIINRDSQTNSEDLKEIRVQVWDGARTRLYESIRTLLSFGGV
jgi:type II secretory pathway pseudopilin PulG